MGELRRAAAAATVEALGVRALFKGLGVVRV